MGKLCTTGKARQTVYDAIKKAREEGEAWVTFHDKRLKLISPDNFPDYGYGPGGHGLVNVKGRIVFTEVWSKDSKTWCYPDEKSWGYNIQLDRILAYVAEAYDRETGKKIHTF